MGQALFSLLRPAYESTPELAALASEVRAEIESSDMLKRQIEFDDRVAQELSALKLTASHADAFENLLSEPGLNAHSERSRIGTSKSGAALGRNSQNQPEAQSKEG